MRKNSIEIDIENFLKEYQQICDHKTNGAKIIYDKKEHMLLNLDCRKAIFFYINNLLKGSWKKKAIFILDLLTIRKKRFGKTFVRNFPNQSIIIIPDFTNGIIVINFDKKTVFKMVKGKFGIKTLNNEIEVLKDNRISKIIPRIEDFGCGESKDVKFIEMEFFPNKKPFNFFEWENFLSEELIPFLWDFYYHWGIEEKDGDEYLEYLIRKSKEGKFFQEIEDIAFWGKQAINNCKDKRVFITRVHGDLAKKHVHRNNKGVKLIDWGYSTRASVLFDYFVLENRFRTRDKNKDFEFCNFLVGKKVGENFGNYYNWPPKIITQNLKKVYNYSLCMENLRFQIMICILEKFLVNWRFRGWFPQEHPYTKAWVDGLRSKTK